MKRILIFTMLMCASVLPAQNITNTLGTSGIFSIVNGANTYFTVRQNTGLVGIGTNATDPRAQLEIGGTEGLLVRGTINSGTVRALGAGVRMHWYPRKGAFRVGNAETSYWDDDGSSNPKMALYSIAMGYQPRASAVASTAIGAYNQAIGDYALSLGSYSQATASHAIAIGTQVYATGIYSIALGSGANTNGRDGAVVIGDDCYFQTAYANMDNQITMRFTGYDGSSYGAAYRFWSWYPDSTAGVYLNSRASGWSAYCSKWHKTNFKEIDGEELLGKIRDIPVTEWNLYSAPEIKYIGPTAQDFAATFNLNGGDTLGINSVSIDGVNMAGVKALEKRTSAMRTEIETLRTGEEAALQLRSHVDQLKEENLRLREDIELLKSEIKKQNETFQTYVKNKAGEK